MEAERPSLDRAGGFGSWHPALRPNSDNVPDAGAAHRPRALEDEDEDAGSKLRKPEVMPPINIEKRLKSEETHEGHAEESGPNANTAPQMHATGTESIIKDLQRESAAFNVDPNHLEDESSREVLSREQNARDLAVDPPSSQSFSQGQQTSFDKPIESATAVDQPRAENSEHHVGLQEIKAEIEAKNEMDAAFDSEIQFEAMGTDYANQINSFPEVPPVYNSTALPAKALPKSQAEDILEEDEAAEKLQKNPVVPVVASDPTGFPDDDEDQDFFTKLNGMPADPLSPPIAEEDSRFEEGLPLVPSEHHDKNQRNQTDDDALFSVKSQVGEEDDDAGFFEKPVSTPEDLAFRPKALDRKTTTQVLDALHYTSHDNKKLAPEANESKLSTDAPREGISSAPSAGGGVAVSLHTVESQVLLNEKNQPTDSKSKEDDLAEMWKAALDDDDLLGENDTSLDPSTLFGDDDGFLEDLTAQDEDNSKDLVSPPLEPVYNSNGRMQGFDKVEQRPNSSSSRYIPDGAVPQTLSSNSPAYQQNQFSNTSNSSSPQVSTGSLRNSVSTPLGFGAMGSTVQQPYGALAPQRPQMPASAQSFADKSKAGYTSPYDLPMDVSRPRKRAHLPQNVASENAAATSANRPPPPRSSSMYTGTPPLSQPYSPSSNPSPTDPGPPPAQAMPSSVKPKPSTGSFFEDLAPKPRPPTRSGKYTPPVGQPQTSNPPPMAPSMSRQGSLDQFPPQANAQASPNYNLRQPEKMGLYAGTNSSQPPNQAVPAINSRYSPAPSQAANVLPPRNRYASSPFGAPPPPTQALPFQPRTSSPLAHSSVPRSLAANRDDEVPHNISRPAAPPLPHPSYQQQHNAVPSADSQGEASPPRAVSRYAPLSDSPSSGSQAIYTPGTDRLSSEGLAQQQSPLDHSSMHSFNSIPRMPPQRSQTQSPGAARAIHEIPPNQIPYQRPASVSDRKVSLSAYTPNYAPSTAAPQELRRPRGISEIVNFIRPTDGRENDPLERWKGCPIVTFGFGGNVATAFPVHVPRYAPGQKVPMVKCSPGEVKIRTSSFFTLEESTTNFPGPLKAKGKKKDVLEWMQRRIGDLGGESVIPTNSGLIPDPAKCHEEKILLWKIVRAVVEYDGTIDGNQAAEQVVRMILSPELSQGDAAVLPAGGVFPASSAIARRAGSTRMTESLNPDALEDLRKILLHGDREKAAWFAVDNRMWAHAMLIASTLDQQIWKQVSSEFVKQEVKSFGENTESLSALYQIFSGNGDESIDELVPPSARAGLQMISKAAPSGPTRNALDGLDRWRETLTLILSNRTPEDGKALVSLGQLLAGYGRIEAAHICYLFAKTPTLFGGPDDPQVGVVLLGADHLRQPFDYARDLDSVLLTEVYDFARTILAAASAVTVSPHLQSYKLYHATILAEYGHKVEAQAYCDAITSALKSTTKLSPYYHPLLFGALENLTDRLRQAPKDGSGSWISKPSIDKVSGSIWAKFNSYVAGDDSDAASTGSSMPNEADAGPFAGITGAGGDSPDLSRSQSIGDLYGAQTSGLALAPASMPTSQPVSSRYAPAALPTPRSSQEQARNTSIEPQRPDSLRPTYISQSYSSRPVSSNGPVSDLQKPRYQPVSYASTPEQSLPTPPTQVQQMSEVPPDQPLCHQEPYQPTPPLEPDPNGNQYQPSFGGMPVDSYNASQDTGALSSGYAAPMSGYTPPTTEYGPPTSDHDSYSGGGYEPPSYNPPSYDPDVPQTESPIEEKPKKRDIMNDDDDFEDRGATLRKEERARKDREADERMRKAAEEDGKLLILNKSNSHMLTM